MAIVMVVVVVVVVVVLTSAARGGPASFVAADVAAIGRRLDHDGRRGHGQRPLLLLLQEAEINAKPLPLEAKREALALRATRLDVVVG